MDAPEKPDITVNAWDQAYRAYQEALTSRFLIPVLTGWSVALKGKRLLEVGCGDGGCAAEFSRAGCSVTAVDIDTRLVDIARVLSERDGLEIGAHVGDIRAENCPGLADGPFDIVVMRDVVEHLDDLVAALANVCKNLVSTGIIFVVFPPYYSAYGAHQQTLPRKKLGFIPYNKMPYIQVLPDGLFGVLTRGLAEANLEVARLRKIRLTIRKFEKQVKTAGLRVSRTKYYLSRPSFKLRYGFPVIGAGLLGKIPVLRELFVTAAYYLLEKRR